MDTSFPIYGREKEKETLTRWLIDEAPSAVYIYGVSRIGKTTLMRWCQKELVEAEGLISVSIDFDKENEKNRYERENEGRRHLLKDISTQLTRKDEKIIGILDNEVKNFLELVQESRKPLIFWLDTLEKAPKDTFRWLQEEIIGPLMNSNFRVVYAGLTRYNELRLSFPWSIRRFIKEMHLRSFTPEKAEGFVLLRRGKKQDDVKKIYLATQGIPGLIKDGIDAVIERTIYPDKLSDYIVENIILRPRQEEIREAIQKHKTLLLYLAVLRNFDANLVTKVDELIEKGKTTEKINKRSGTKLIKDLRETTLVEMHPNGYGYRIPADNRKILNLYMLRKHGHEYGEINGLAYEWYTKEFREKAWTALADQLYYILQGLAYQNYQKEHSISDSPTPFGNHIGTEVNADDLPKYLEYGVDGEGGLQKIKTEDTRWHNTIGKIRYVLDSDAFLWYLEEGKIRKLQDICDIYLNDD